MIYRLVVGDSPYSENVTSLEDYYFNTVAFIPYDISNGTNKRTFVRVLGFLFGKEKAKEKYDRWISDFLNGEDVAKELEKENIFLGNISEAENIERFLRIVEDDNLNLKILLLGDSAIENEETFKKYDVYKFTHPTPVGSSMQLFEKIDFMYDKNYDDIEKIIREFQVKL